MLVCLKLWKGGRRQEAGGRRQANDIKGGGKLDLCDIPLLTICKLYEHIICEINNECIIDEWPWLTVYKRFYCIARKWVCQLRLSATHGRFRLLRP